jgi:ribonuclease P protein component
VLSARYRLRQPADFAAVIRRGVRAGRPGLVLHLLLADGPAGAEPLPASVPALLPARVGFVVPKSVGNAVVRNQVTRRLRALCAARIDTFAPGSRLVVRALPPAASCSSAQLAEQLDSATATVLRKAGARVGHDRVGARR